MARLYKILRFIKVSKLKKNFLRKSAKVIDNMFITAHASFSGFLDLYVRADQN